MPREAGATYECPECGRSITVSPDGETEYGHARGYNYDSFQRCSRRPARVDPDSEAKGGPGVS